ncbi:MAG TPA: alpha/beta hydrolase [Nocardioides sp.]|uniref:alpha/beta hydrolase n=1 Tax=Nocardioides sp. TaxID=35761 RepID=UPI002D7F05CA|nr:alpha/beta hydrolase [Nocardioides sp.]HET6651996.1 alpha/beta hydrolase [Nocardioides sp.]
MSRTYLLRQLLTAALTANAVRPVPGYWAGVPSMLGGWLTSELAPHLLTLTAADTARELARGRPSRAGLALAAGSAVGLGALVAEASAARRHVDEALREALGVDYLDRLGATYTDLDLSTPLSQLAWPFRLHSDEVEVTKDVPYHADHGKRGLLDVYRQRDTELRDAPVLLQIHGGAWSVGSKDTQGVPLMLHMAARGWVCVAINYRLSPRDRFPAHIVDVKRAIAWVREHVADHGGNPGFLALTGGSAGGHLTALAALTPNDAEYQPGFEHVDTTVQAAVPFYGVYDLAGSIGTRRALQMRDRFLAPRVLLGDPASDLEPFERASPILRVRRDAPPMLVVHGARDSLVEVEQARQFVARLRAVSERPVAYAELPGTQHAFDVFPSIRSAAVVRGVDRFLRSTYDDAVRAAR